VITSVTFAYHVHEDRILAAINLGRPEEWSCWMTRRLVLTLLDRAGKFLADTSTLVQQASAELRDDMIAFEREAAIAKTARAVSRAQSSALKTPASEAELLLEIDLAQRGERFRLKFRAKNSSVDGVVAKAELERILQMLKTEGARANWFPADAPVSAKPVSSEKKPKRFRH